MRLVIIIVALLIAGLVAFGASTFLDKNENSQISQVLSQAPVAQEPQIQKVNIFVAQRDIPIGSVISATDYEVKPWPQHLLPPGAMVYGAEGQPNIEGMIARTPIVKDEPLLLSKLRNPNDPSYIAGQLGEGMRAITINVGLTSSVAGFVSPGDRVDVIFTFELVKSAVQGSDVAGTKNASENGNVSFTEVMLPNVKILAVDKAVVSTPPAADGQPTPIPTSVTIEVNQRDAQKLRLAEKMGSLSLALRSAKDKDSYDMVRPTAEQDLTKILPPAYFPVLFDSDAAYDFGVVDLYGANLSTAKARDAGVLTINPQTGKLEKKSGNEPISVSTEEKQSGQNDNNRLMSINVYRGVQLDKVEVTRP